jgi:hypothetical protein
MRKGMARKHKPEEIIGKLREAEIVQAQGGVGPDAPQADPAGGCQGKLLSSARSESVSVLPVESFSAC